MPSHSQFSMSCWPQLVIFLGLLLSIPAQSRIVKKEFKSKQGFEVKGLVASRTGKLGWLGGLRLGRYFGHSHVYYGAAGSFGAPSGVDPTTDFLGYAGMMIGQDRHLGSGILYDLALVVGYGEGKLRSRVPEVTEKSFFAEPSIALGVLLSDGYRLKLALSYFYMSSPSEFTGITVGIRIEFKSHTTIKPIHETGS